MDNLSTSDYIVYVDYRSTSNEMGYSCGTVKADSLSNIMKNQVIIANEIIYDDKASDSDQD